MIETLKEKLDRLPPDASVVWCEKCGHVAATANKRTERLQDGTHDCGLTLALGTPAECAEAMN